KCQPGHRGAGTGHQRWGALADGAVARYPKARLVPGFASTGRGAQGNQERTLSSIADEQKAFHRFQMIIVTCWRSKAKSILGRAGLTGGAGGATVAVAVVTTSSAGKSRLWPTVFSLVDWGWCHG